MFQEYDKRTKSKRPTDAAHAARVTDQRVRTEMLAHLIKKMSFMYITTGGLETGRNIIMDIRELPIREIDEGLRVN